MVAVDTTDVQSVTIAPHTTDTSSNIALLECTFIAGSDARGCMVVLLGKFDNITTNLTKEDSHSSTIIQVVDSLSCYGELIGFDIESDGSVGTVAVPGVILLNISMMTTCIRKLSPGGFVDYYTIHT